MSAFLVLRLLQGRYKGVNRASRESHSLQYAADAIALVRTTEAEPLDLRPMLYLERK